VRRYEPYLLRIAARYDIGDAVEHAVARTFARLVEQGGSIRGSEAVRCWLALTIREECLTALRQRRREQPTDPANVDALSPPVTVVGRDAVADVPVEDVHLGFGQAPANIHQLPFGEEGQSHAVHA
jgi:DNA-directed RNA polymerase specialized sigma24 family protein